MTTLKSLVDETTNIKDELVTCYTNLKNNLVDKGVEVLPSDKMLILIDKVGDIPLGKKWASGVSKSEYLTSARSNYVGIDLNLIDFEPSIILAFNVTGSIFTVVAKYIEQDARFNSKNVFANIDISKGQSTQGYFALYDDVNVGSKLYMYGNNANIDYNWIAYE